jgi:hypothetical protein
MVFYAFPFRAGDRVITAWAEVPVELFRVKASVEIEIDVGDHDASEVPRRSEGPNSTPFRTFGPKYEAETPAAAGLSRI